jgi:hypothetical protein
MRQLYDGAIIDTLTGAVTNRDGNRAMWKIIQEGSSVSDSFLLQEPSHLIRQLPPPASSACALGRKSNGNSYDLLVRHYGFWALRGGPLTVVGVGVGIVKARSTTPDE